MEKNSDVKKNVNNCYKNIKNEFEKKNRKKMLYNDLIKSSQKSNSRISIFTNKISNNNRKNKKEKSFNLKQKEISKTNLKKSISNNKDIIKEKKEKNTNIKGNECLAKKGNKLNNKKQKNITNNNKESKGNNIYNKNDSLEQKKQKMYNEQNISSLKKIKKKESIYNSPLINQNSDDDLVTSFEKKPSELKSPETISEDSFITDKEDFDNNNKQLNDKKEKFNTNTIEKKEKNEENNHIKNNDDDDHLIEQNNEIIYVDKIKKLYIENEKKEKWKENNKSKKNKNKDRNEINNIKVNVKISFLNNKEKSNFGKGGYSKYSIQNKKQLNEILNNSKEKNYKKNTNKINNKNINNSSSSIILRSNIPKIQKCITVKKNDIFNYNIEKKYNRNTSKNNQNEYLEPIQELQKNVSNLSLKFFSDTKISNLKNNKNKYKKNKNEKNKLYKNLNQIEDKYEDLIFHKKLKIDNKIDLQKIKRKDISSSNNKNANISSNLNNTFKEDEIINKKINRDNIKLKIYSKESDLNNTSNNNIKLIKENKENKENKQNNDNIKNQQIIYYLKKNSHLANKNNNKLALKIDDSNSLFNNCKKMFTNMSGNNKIYSKKNPGLIRVRSHEKNIGNIYNNMSYDPNRIKKTHESNSKNYYKERYFNIINNSYNKKNSDLDLQNLIKNNSFNEEFDNYGQILLNNENDLNSLRLNSFNNFAKIFPINFGSLNENIRMEDNNNCNMNYYNKTAEKPFTNNSIFMINRLKSVEGINLNNYMSDFNKSFFGINLNTDFNNYNMNIFNNKSIANKMNQYPIGYNMGMMSPIHNNINQTNLINLFNNNYLNFNTIQNKASSFINNNNNLNDSLFYFPNNNQNISPSINIEDIIILQEKLKDIINSLNKIKTMANECFEFWNYYYNCSIYCQIEKLFPNPIESNIIRISINYELLSIMVCYDYSFDQEILNKSFSILLNIMKLNYKNLIIICEYILSKISNENKNNVWVKKLKNIINSYKKIENIKINNISSGELINNNTNIILQNLHIILTNFKTRRNESLLNFLNKIHEKTYEQINIFFRDYILRTNNLNGSILASVFLRSNKQFNTLPSPYVRTKNNKEFSLVLDLDETLVHFKEKKDGKGGGILRIRPGINEFLEEVGKYYELILFTTATQDYADILIDAVEEDKIYFDHRLYRDHAVIIDNDFVKDLNRIGRPLDKIIIVDNMPQNFRLQKENGIMIKAFWGEDNYDTALSNLIPILINIAKERNDVRKGLEKYKDVILKKVSLNITKENT